MAAVVSAHRLTPPRRAHARLLAGCVVWGILAAGGGAARAAAPASLNPTIQALNPRPDAVLPADGPSAYMAARLTATTPIRGAAVRLDGRRIEAEVLGPDDRHQSLFARPLHWRPGRHHVVVLSWDARGRQSVRSWSFWIVSRSPPAR